MKGRTNIGMKVVNEMAHFDFHDAQVMAWERKANGYIFTLEAVVARHNNTCNDTLTDRYCDTLTLRLENAKIEDILIEGYKYYDANDVLQEEKPDTVISEAEYADIMKKCKDAYIFEVAEKEKKGDMFRYLFLIDTDEETTYCVTIQCEKTVAQWEHLMNKQMQ